MIKKLKDLVPTTEKEIDRHYYYCYGEGSVQVEKTGDVVVYIIKGERFGDYLHNAYGKSVAVPNLQKDYKFQRVDAYGADYTSSYGYPKVDHDFSCLSGPAYKGYGSINHIDGANIYVTAHDGAQHTLKVGSCSRLEATHKVPKVGQSIYYSAVPSGAQGYNLISGSCF